ncbi:hypothetical protein D3C78_1727490 [compost metagenome]
MSNPAASSCSDMNLLRTLKNYDQKKDVLITVEKIPFNAIFALPNGRKFQKLALVRKRFKCVELSTKRMYLFNPLAEIVEIKQD